MNVAVITTTELDGCAVGRDGGSKDGEADGGGMMVLYFMLDDEEDKKDEC